MTFRNRTTGRSPSASAASLCPAGTDLSAPLHDLGHVGRGVERDAYGADQFWWKSKPQDANNSEEEGGLDQEGRVADHLDKGAKEHAHHYRPAVAEKADQDASHRAEEEADPDDPDGGHEPREDRPAVAADELDHVRAFGGDSRCSSARESDDST